MDHFYKVQICIQKEVLIQFLVPYSVVNFGYQTRKEKKKKGKKEKDLLRRKSMSLDPWKIMMSKANYE